MNNGIKLLLVFLLSFVVGFGGVFAIKTLKTKIEDKTTTVSRRSGGGGGSSSGSTSQAGGSSSGVVTTGSGIGSGTTEAGTVQVAKQEQGLKHQVEQIALQQHEIELDLRRVKVNLAVGSTSYHYTVKGIQAKDAESGDVLTETQVRFYLEDGNGHSYQSTDGTFNDVAPTSGGSYRIYAQDITTNKKTGAETINGFVIKTPIDRLSASELTSIFNTGDYASNSARLKSKCAPSVRIVNQTAGLAPNTYQEVFMAVDLEGWQVTVTALDYDCLGQITRITLRGEQ